VPVKAREPLSVLLYPGDTAHPQTRLYRKTSLRGPHLNGSHEVHGDSSDVTVTRFVRKGFAQSRLQTVERVKWGAEPRRLTRVSVRRFVRKGLAPDPARETLSVLLCPSGTASH
jgi:hypothetical protein